MGLIELWFRLSEVAPIVEHAMSASEHTKYPDPNDDSPAVPSLIWVKDDGTYLLSNGRPRLLADPTQPEGKAQVAYAQNWGPGTGPEIGYTPVGGDDFTEYIDLTQDVYSGDRLSDLIRKYAELDGWMIFTVGPGQFDISFEPSNPNSYR
ncbi:DUF3085 domain-containing protein [Nocardia iowensis]|uniref:DUF3085 domain-containing protein n=1 Tax=Nocardia iowensis TaxID=204891 RepID=A0ABX8S2G7_NOCIO|nr:DUF3085 domain-containing protein [Nocardia iowensis]QXN94755.1 DUF3085 domain-containing protein [Nocardia iowensis]